MEEFASTVYIVATSNDLNVKVYDRSTDDANALWGTVDAVNVCFALDSKKADGSGNFVFAYQNLAPKTAVKSQTAALREYSAYLGKTQAASYFLNSDYFVIL